MPRLVLTGYFGCGNLGDDAILLGLLQLLGNKGYEVTVASGRPEETRRMYGVSAFPRKDMNAFKAEMERCDALVFGGGSIFQDSSSVGSALFYSNLVRTAKKANKKVVLLGQGIGPLTSFIGKRAAMSAFQAADAIAVRDPGSVQTLKSLGFNKPVSLTGDLAFLLPKPNQTGDDPDKFQVGNMKAVGVSVRPHGKGQATLKLFGDFSKQLFANDYMPVMLELDESEDGPLIQELAKSQGGRIPNIRRMGSPMQLQQRMLGLRAVVGMRLHAGILSATLGVPPFMVSYDPKVGAFAKMMDLPFAPSLENLDGARLFQLFAEFDKDHDKWQQRMATRVDELKAQAEKNLEVLSRVVPA